MNVTEDDKQKLMEQYGITTEQQSMYRYAGFRYSNFTDALDYAQRVTSRANESRAAAKPR
jgi:hypothetical protein